MKSNETASIDPGCAALNGLGVGHIHIPPLEDLATDEIDFMSAESFPASDPPSYSPPVFHEDRKIANHHSDEKSEVLHAPRARST